MSENGGPREFRIYRNVATQRLLVQYGYWRRSQTGLHPRFSVLREWPAADLTEAQQLKANLLLDVLLDPSLAVPPEAVPLPPRNVRVRKLREVPADVRQILRQAVEGLPDPLPSAEEACAKLGVDVPRPFRDGYHFGSYLNQAVFRQLVAMAGAAGVTRNRMLESLILMAGESIYAEDRVANQ